MIVLDTNVVSELMKPTPALVVRDWVLAWRAVGLATTAVTLAEIRYGVERLPDGRRKASLRSAADDVFRTFEDQVLAFDTAAATVYAAIVDGRERAGRPIDGFDAQIAAICSARDARLATRNVADFTGTGVEVVDPWST